MNYYEILGITKEATQSEIKKAYRKLAHKWHPDHNPDNPEEASTKFKQINEAYKTLSDQRRKQDYDNPRQSFRGNEFPSGFNSFFDQFFHDNQQRGESGSHIVVELPVTLQEVLSGCEKEVTFTRSVLCKSCQGNGGVRVTCERCHGQGWEQTNGSNLVVRHPCSACNGTKTKVVEKCKDCSGHGYGQDKEEVANIAIPKGIHDGLKMTFRGEGNPGRMGGSTGHLIVSIITEKHPLFRRETSDLYCEVPVTYTQLVLGSELEVPTLEGLANLKVPNGTQPNLKFRMRERGLPRFNSPESRGDLYVVLKLNVPKEVSNEMKEILTQLQELESPNTK